MTAFVFLGPSLPLHLAEPQLDGVWLPPVAMGDLYALVATRARAGDHVAIIDGLFEQVPAVWHKEILFALGRGIHVYGASSMGALRAAETEQFGMVGIGRIFEAYRDGSLTDDDEVAVSHATAEHGYRSLSTAMASIRFGIAALVDAGALDAEAAELLLGRAKAQHYSERNWGDILGWARELGVNSAGIAALREEAAQPDAKARDALALLAHLAGKQERSEPFAAEFVFNTTSYWTALTQTRAAEVGEEQQRALFAPRRAELEIAASYRAAGAERERMLDRALFDFLILREDADKPDPQDLRLAAQRIAQQNGLADVDALQAWRRAQRLSDAEWQALLDLDARRERLRAALAARLDPLLLLALKRTGQFDTAVTAAGRATAAAREAGLTGFALEDWGLTPAAVEAWYRERFGALRPDPERHARALGFATLRDFLAEVVKALIADGGAPAQPSAAVPPPVAPDSAESGPELDAVYNRAK